MKKIFITRAIPEFGVNLLKERGYEVDVSPFDRALEKNELINYLQQKPYDGLIPLLTDIIDAEVLDACPTLKSITNYAVGYNNINLEETKKRNILVSCARGTSAQAVAEHTIALILASNTHLVEADKFVRNRQWKGWDPHLFLGQDLHGKIIGLVGSGNIGCMVGKVLFNGFGCSIMYYDIKENNDLETNCNAKKVELNELLQTADIVSVHLPLFKETTHILNKDNLKLMKKTAVLINTARGPIINELDLIEILKNKQIYAAGLDVFETEPNVNEELLKLNNVVLTPHIASARESARSEMTHSVVDNTISILEKGVAITEVK